MFINKGKAILESVSGKAYGMKYDAGFLLQCLLLKMKSSTTYKHMRDNKILPLPSPSTIRRLLSSSDCKFGFNELALNSIKRELDGLPLSQRWGSLMWDEMSLKKDLTWNAQTLEWHGVVDYGELETPVKNGVANHALVFIFRPYRGNWVQPIACFASENAANGDVLHELITKATCLLHQSNAIVKSVVSDGCASNKKVMGLLGVTSGDSEAEPCRPYFLHAMDEEIKIYWFTDVPHLLKCVRNYALLKRTVQVYFKVNIANL